MNEEFQHMQVVDISPGFAARRLFFGSTYVGSVSNSDMPDAAITALADRIASCWNACDGLDPAAVPVMSARIAELEAELSDLRHAGKCVVASAMESYTARNGKRCRIEADDGELCYIVHSDDILLLKACLVEVNEETIDAAVAESALAKSKS